MQATSIFPGEAQIVSNANLHVASKEESFMANGNLTRLFFTFCIPGICGILFMSLQNLADGLLLGHFSGAIAMASINVALPCFSVLFAVALVVAVGCETLVSIGMGQGKVKHANDVFITSCALSCGFAILWGTIVYVFAPQIMSFSGGGEVLLPLSVTYLRTLAFFFPVIGLLFLLDYVLKSLGRPVYAMIVMTSIVILNIVLDILFIAGFGWGVFGAALATGISFSLGCIGDLIPLCRGQLPLSFAKGRFQPALVKRVLYCGSAEGVSECATGLSVLLFNIMLMWYVGPLGIAAFTILNYFLYIAVAMYLGTADGVRPVLGYNFGKKQLKRVQGILSRALLGVMTIGLGLGLIVFFGSEYFLAMLFTSSDAAVAQMATTGSKFIAFGIAISGVNILVIGYFTSVGRAKIAGILAGLRSFVFVGLGLLILPYIWGVNGIWMVLPLAELLALCVSIPLLRYAYRQ